MRKPTCTCLPDEKSQVQNLREIPGQEQKRAKQGFLGRLFSLVPGCSRHAGPQKDRSDGRKGPQETRCVASRRRRVRRGSADRVVERPIEHAAAYEPKLRWTMREVLTHLRPQPRVVPAARVTSGAGGVERARAAEAMPVRRRRLPVLPPAERLVDVPTEVVNG
jgi:hypothetical protein